MTPLFVCLMILILTASVVAKIEFFKNTSPTVRRAVLRLVGGDRRHRGKGFPAPSFNAAYARLTNPGVSQVCTF